jgi:hypothetical protein
VYQVNVGMPSPTFFAFVPMRTLAQNDDLLNLRDLLHEAEGEAAERMQQIAFTLLAPKSPTYRKSLRRAIRNFGRQNRQRQ